MSTSQFSPLELQPSELITEEESVPQMTPHCKGVICGITWSLIQCILLPDLLTMSTHQHTDHMQMALEGMQGS